MSVLQSLLGMDNIFKCIIHTTALTIMILHCLTCVCPAPTITRKNVERSIIDMNNSSFTNEELWPKMDLSLNLVSPAFGKEVGTLFISEKQAKRKIRNSGPNERRNSEHTTTYGDTAPTGSNLLYYFI